MGNYGRDKAAYELVGVLCKCVLYGWYLIKCMWLNANLVCYYYIIDGILTFSHNKNKNTILF